MFTLTISDLCKSKRELSINTNYPPQSQRNTRHKYRHAHSSSSLHRNCFGVFIALHPRENTLMKPTVETSADVTLLGESKCFVVLFMMFILIHKKERSTEASLSKRSEKEKNSSTIIRSVHLIVKNSLCLCIKLVSLKIL